MNTGLKAHRLLIRHNLAAGETEFYVEVAGNWLPVTPNATHGAQAQAARRGGRGFPAPTAKKGEKKGGTLEGGGGRGGGGGGGEEEGRDDQQGKVGGGSLGEEDDVNPNSNSNNNNTSSSPLTRQNSDWSGDGYTPWDFYVGSRLKMLGRTVTLKSATAATQVRKWMEGRNLT